MLHFTPTKLGVKGSTKRLAVTNTLLKTIEFDSRLVSFEISSASHLNKIIKIKNAWVVSDINFRH